MNYIPFGHEGFTIQHGRADGAGEAGRVELSVHGGEHPLHHREVADMAFRLCESVVLLAQPLALLCGEELVQDRQVTLAAGKALWVVGRPGHQNAT